MLIHEFLSIWFPKSLQLWIGSPQPLNVDSVLGKKIYTANEIIIPQKKINIFTIYHIYSIMQSWTNQRNTAGVLKFFTNEN